MHPGCTSLIHLFVDCYLSRPADLLDAIGIQIGATKVFVRQNAYDFIESFRSQKLDQSSRKIQRVSRGFIARRRFVLAHERIIVLQAVGRRFLVRRQLEVQSHGAIVIQAVYRRKIARGLSVARKRENVREMEEQLRKAAIADKLKSRHAIEAGGEKAAPPCALKKVSEKPEEVRSEVTDLKEEIQKMKAELKALKKEALVSKARVAELEAENNNMKRQMEQGMFDGTYKSKNTEKYEDQPDLYNIAEGIYGLTCRSQKSKSDLDALVKMLEILK